MSRSIGIAGAFFAGVRVAGKLTYVPEHMKAGKKVNSRCVIPVYKNSHRGTNAKTGEQGRSDSFKFVAWGKLADTCAKSLPVGKAIDCLTDPQSYLGNLFAIDGSIRMDNAGIPIQVNKISFTIMNIVFGEESAKSIDEEVATGRRPVNWSVPTHPDYQLWTSILHQRQAVVWNGEAEFGYARVVVPQGQGIVVTPGVAIPQQNQSVTQYANNQATAPVNSTPAFATPAPGTPAQQFMANTNAPVAPNVKQYAGAPGTIVIPAGAQQIAGQNIPNVAPPATMPVIPAASPFVATAPNTTQATAPLF